MSVKQWAQCILVGAITPALTLAVAYGALELTIDSAHRILH